MNNVLRVKKFSTLLQEDEVKGQQEKGNRKLAKKKQKKIRKDEDRKLK